MRILLVEDNLMLAESLVALLERKGVEIVHCESTKAALEQLLGQDFDVLVSDWSLKDAKSDSLFEVVAESLPSMRRILMSGEADASYMARQGLAQAFYLKDGKLGRCLMQEVASASAEVSPL